MLDKEEIRCVSDESLRTFCLFVVLVRFNSTSYFDVMFLSLLFVYGGHLAELF